MVQLVLNEAEKQLATIIQESNQKLRLYSIGEQESSLQSWVIGERLAEILLKNLTCQAEWEKEHIFGIWMVYVPELDLWGTGETKEEAAEDLISAAEDYREVFLKCIAFYLGAGREKHLPYVLRLALARGNREKIKKFLGL